MQTKYTDNRINLGPNGFLVSVLEAVLKCWKVLLVFYLLPISVVCVQTQNIWLLIAAISMFLVLVLFALNVKLSMSANKDMLTGLANKYALTAILEREVSRIGRNSGLLVFFFVDIDNFKKINDTCGHKFGDSVLIEVANRLVAQKRKYDELIRYGGDEFCIVCSQVNNEDDAVQIKNKLNEVLHFYHRAGNEKVLVQSSCGMAIYPTDCEDLQQLIAIADRRMYEQKEQRKLSRMANQ